MKQLMKHQEEGLAFLKGRPSAGIFFEPGTGKTLLMLEHLTTIKRPFPALIVAPLSGVAVWEGEIKKFGYPFSVSKLIGTYKKRKEQLARSADIYLINYEGLRIMDKFLEAKNFKTMICDESHRACNRGTQQTKIAIQLSQTIYNRYILTGTPITKSPEDIWTQFQIVAPGHLGNFYAFQAQYIDYKKINIKVKGGSYREIRKPVRFKHLAELNKRLEVHSMRKTKAECLDLPEKIYKLVPCPITPKQLKHYHELKHSLGTIIDGDHVQLNAAVAVMQKLQQICQGFIYTDKGAKVIDSGKQQIFLDLMEDLREEKVVVFTWFQYDVELICKELTAKGYKVLLYDGKFEERAAIINEFQNCKEPCVLVSNIEKIKESVTLTASSHVVYYGNTWRYDSRVQSEDRTHRKGQTKKVVYYDLVVPNTIDQIIYDSLQYKGDLAGKITGDTVRLAKLVMDQQERGDE